MSTLEYIYTYIEVYNIYIYIYIYSSVDTKSLNKKNTLEKKIYFTPTTNILTNAFLSPVQEAEKKIYT